MLSGPVERSGVVARAGAFHMAARELGVPVVFTRFTVPIGGGDLVPNTDFMRAVADSQEAFRPHSRGSSLIEEMADQADEVFDNQRLSGLACSDLPEWLSARGIDTVFLTGVATNLTVEQTARHGTDLGLTVHPTKTCVAAADDASHDSSLRNLDLTTAGCMDADTVVKWLRDG